MAATQSEQQNQQQLNGEVNGEFVPVFNDDDENKSYRPPDIEADVREMERRRRVEQMITSRSFRDDLERVVEQQLSEGGTEGLFALQQRISDITGLGFNRAGGMSRCVVPINDIRPTDVAGYIKGEKILRCKLAAFYRLVHLFGWSHSVFNHITARLSQDLEHFLVNPYGLLYGEVTASSLVKVDMQGNIVDEGSTNFGVDAAGFDLHSAIHAARPDAKCVAHVRHSAVLAVSGMKCGFLMLSQESTIIGDVSYHEYTGNSIDPTERDLIARNLGPVNKVMFLHNHGALILGESIEEVFLKMHSLILACQTQVHLMPIGLENLVIVSDEAKKRSLDVVKNFPEFVQSGRKVRSDEEGDKKDETDDHKEHEPRPRPRGIQWKCGELEFEAHMRMLDNSGYRTGYPYRVPMIKNEPPRQKYDVEVPPAVSSFGYLIEEDELYKNSPLKKHLDGRRSLDRSRWINSPNAYQKVEFLEQGSTDPKKITKWVQHGSPAHGTQIRLENSHQFVPLGTNPKEFKQKQKQIKENRRQGGISAGPQSHILEGVTWDEAKTLQDAAMSGTGEVILVGAASKGIIQRDFQHHAMVYRTPYAKNPFDSVTDQELEDYKKTIERKQKGINDDSLEVSVSTTPAPVLEPLVAEPVILTPHEERKPPLPPASPVMTPTTPTSPASDAEYEARPRVVEVATTKVPQADTAQRQLLPPDEKSDTGTPEPHVERSKSARFPRDASGDAWELFKRRSWSLGRDKKKHSKAAADVNGDELDNPQSTVSQSSRDESSARDVSTEDSPSKKEKKKKKGLRTPSFLKKKSKDKKKAAAAEA